MAAEYSVSTPQTVQPNQPIVFSDEHPCRNGNIFKRGGVFLLASNAPRSCGCSCGCGCKPRYETDYGVEVHANIEIPTGGTVEEIQLAIAVDGIIDPTSIMSYTPAAVEVAGNVGMSIVVGVPSLCGCDNVSVVNASTQPITVTNATVTFDYDGVKRIR